MSSTKIILFDIDGTLTKPRKKMNTEMSQFLLNLKKTHKIGCVGGSDFIKAKEQVGDNILELFDYCFFENGLVFYKDNKLVNKESLKEYLGEDKIKTFVNYVLHYIADLSIPVKRGTFIEFRNGMINVSPIGRNCSQEERDAFERYDNEHKIRLKMINHLKSVFEDYNFTYSIGGQISFDVFPNGWDKTFCLKFLKDDFVDIYFIGDKTYPGGNDYEIYISEDTISFTTTSPEDTIRILNNNFNL